jgi:hypothetical protein
VIIAAPDGVQRLSDVAHTTEITTATTGKQIICKAGGLKWLERSRRGKSLEWTRFLRAALGWWLGAFGTTLVTSWRTDIVAGRSPGPLVASGTQRGGLSWWS